MLYTQSLCYFLLLAQQAPPPISAPQHHHTTTYDHTHQKTWDPVRSPLIKLMRVRSVVGSVTTSESLMLYVFFSFLFLLHPAFDVATAMRD